MSASLDSARRDAPVSALGSLRESLGELGALSPRNGPPDTTGVSPLRAWLRTAHRTIEALERVCCTMILCCTGLVRRHGAEQCSTPERDTCS